MPFLIVIVSIFDGTLEGALFPTGNVGTLSSKIGEIAMRRSRDLRMIDIQEEKSMPGNQRIQKSALLSTERIKLKILRYIEANHVILINL